MFICFLYLYVRSLRITFTESYSEKEILCLTVLVYSTGIKGGSKRSTSVPIFGSCLLSPQDSYSFGFFMDVLFHVFHNRPDLWLPCRLTIESILSTAPSDFSKRIPHPFPFTSLNLLLNKKLFSCY